MGSGATAAARRDRGAGAELLQLVKLTGYDAAQPHQLRAASASAWRWPAPSPSGRSCSARRAARALDKKLREETQFELVKIQETLGVTFIVVTHDQEEAMSLATRIG